MVYYFRSLFPSPPSPGTGRVSWSPCWWSWWWLAWWPSPSRLLLLHQDHQGCTNINKCPALKTLLRNPGHRMVYQQIKYSTFSTNTFNATWVSGKPWIQWKVERLTIYKMFLTKCSALYFLQTYITPRLGDTSLILNGVKTILGLCHDNVRIVSGGG